MEIHQRRIVETARKMGIEVTDLSDSWRMDAVLLRHRGREELVIQGRIYGSLSHQADMLAAHKHACKAHLADMGIAVPRGMVFEDVETSWPAISEFIPDHAPVVCKPLDGTDGKGILMDIMDAREVEAHWRAQRGEFGSFLLEEQVAGSDLRVQAIGGALVAACVRAPTTLVGNGRDRVKRLIQAKNETIGRLNPENKVEVDQQVLHMLSERGMNLDSIPAEGVELRIKKVANMAQGATAIDVTDQIHPRYGEWIGRIASSLQLSIFSLDAITSDHRADPSTHAKVLEINAQPAWMHHTFSERRQHDIPNMILKHLFGLH